jgi:hypothetical protein
MSQPGLALYGTFRAESEGRRWPEEIKIEKQRDL